MILCELPVALPLFVALGEACCLAVSAYMRCDQSEHGSVPWSRSCWLGGGSPAAEVGSDSAGWNVASCLHQLSLEAHDHILL